MAGSAVFPMAAVMLMPMAGMASLMAVASVPVAVLMLVMIALDIRIVFQFSRGKQCRCLISTSGYARVQLYPGLSEGRTRPAADTAAYKRVNAALL